MRKHGRLEVITTEEADLWDEALREVGVFDFYHLAAFHRLAEMRGEGRAVMPIFREDGHVVAFPMLFRDIVLPGIYTGNDLRDAVSVSGFVGPVAPRMPIPEDIRRHFHRQLQDFLRQSGIVSVFSSLNPVIGQSSVLSGYGRLVEMGVTLSLDLTAPPGNQSARYARNLRRQVRQLRKMGLTCEEVGPEYLNDFIRVYYETMDRLGAEPANYFDKSYFGYLMNRMSRIMHLFVCKLEGKVICAGLAAACNGIVECHLTGTATEYVQLSPSKLLYDTWREWASRIGSWVLHLGGGLGGRRDSLYEFKRRFGGIERPFLVWRHPVNRQVYGDLCREAFRRAGMRPDDSFFPRYRHPVLRSDETADITCADPGDEV